MLAVEKSCSEMKSTVSQVSSSSVNSPQEQKPPLAALNEKDEAEAPETSALQRQIHDLQQQNAALQQNQYLMYSQQPQQMGFGHQPMPQQQLPQQQQMAPGLVQQQMPQQLPGYLPYKNNQNLNWVVTSTEVSFDGLLSLSDSRSCH